MQAYTNHTIQWTLISEQMQTSCEPYVKNVVLVLVEQLIGKYDSCLSKVKSITRLFQDFLAIEFLKQVLISISVQHYVHV